MENISKCQIDMAKDGMGTLEKINYAIKYLWYSSFIYGIFGDYDTHNQYVEAYKISKKTQENNN